MKALKRKDWLTFLKRVRGGYREDGAFQDLGTWRRIDRHLGLSNNTETSEGRRHLGSLTHTEKAGVKRGHRYSTS